MIWKLRHGVVDFTATPTVMGILNVTPDSFSDGGQFFTPQAAANRADEMVAGGAGIIDIGAESTRPESTPVDPAEQIARLTPVIELIRPRHPHIPLSVDTRSARVAARAIEFGADIINDVSALRDDGMTDLMRDTETPVILMHMNGRPATMQSTLGDDTYGDVVADILTFLSERIACAVDHGLKRSSIAIDPGIGFGKTTAHNLSILQRLGEFVDTGFPVVLGVSRKRIIGELTGRDNTKDRLAGSLACAVAGVLAGAHIIRAHDVRATTDAVRVAAAIRYAT